MIVVDTNVIAYLVIPGDTTSIAEAVHAKDARWAAPWLWRSEMRNLLIIYVRQGILSLAEVQEYMASAEELVVGREFRVVSDNVLTLAAGSGCTAYDCEFVHTAEMLSVPLVSSDKKLLSAFPQITRSMEEFIAS